MKPTILLVDDQPAILRALRRQLARQAKFTVVAAPSVDDAIATLETTDITMILTDYEMEGRNGVDLLREVRSRWPGTRRFLMSGAMVPAADELIGSGLVERFFAKPLEFAAILAALMATQG